MQFDGRIAGHLMAELLDRLMAELLDRLMAELLDRLMLIVMVVSMLMWRPSLETHVSSAVTVSTLLSCH